jgi:hypothetical protein
MIDSTILLGMRGLFNLIVEFTAYYDIWIMIGSLEIMGTTGGAAD